MEEEKPIGKTMTLAEYEERYSSRSNSKRARFLVNFVAGLIGVVVFVCLFLMCKSAYDVHEYFGYAMIGVSVLIFIFLFIVPLIKIKKMPYFEVDVNAFNVGSAKRHNAKVRQDLADRIIDLFTSTGGSVYSSKSVENLIKAKESKKSDELMAALQAIYKGDVKKQAHQIIVKCAVRSGFYSALSQKDTTDALIVTVINLQMIKDIVYLYGFRPSDSKLVRIFGRVLTSALAAYGLSNVNVGGYVAKTIGGVVEEIPILGGLIAAAVDSSIQGLSNGILTATIGHTLINYLMKEYRLQCVLDSVEVSESDEEFARTCEEIQREMQEEKKNKRRGKVTVPAAV